MPAPLRTALPVALLALALLLPASAAAAVERTVSVNASATLEVPNDTARVGLSVSAERRSRGAALRVVSSRLRKVIAAVQRIPGIGEGDVRTGRISVRKAFRGERVVYRAAEGIQITLHEPARAGELVSAGVGAGATGVSGPTFLVGDTEAAYAKALAAAFDKAKLKAAALAAQAGAGLGPALSIQEGGDAEVVPQDEVQKEASSPQCAPAPGPAALRRSRTACAAPPPTKPGTSTVTATVGVVFSLL
ncbi:MAG TPA: SIMPL domain-containing protein [Solirubrobacterales bacterium]|nr:SIMPL domain-containing protein [Solirubrobacterales bacterium]